MQYRRGVYTHWQRTFLHPMFLVFDAPSREECTAERPRSNTPLQALILLNNTTFVEAACALAERLIRDNGRDPAELVEMAFTQSLGRPPSNEEVATLTTLYERHSKEYTQDPNAVQHLISVGQRTPPKDIAAVELAAWTSVARSILILHETITRP